MLFSSLTHAVDGSPVPSTSSFGNYVGIWQDQDNSAHYYSVHYHENMPGGAFVLVDLSGIEAVHDTVKSAYEGSVSNASGSTLSGTLTSLSNANSGLNFQFNTDFSGSLSPSCGATASCTTNTSIVRIKKVF